MFLLNKSILNFREKLSIFLFCFVKADTQAVCCEKGSFKFPYVVALCRWISASLTSGFNAPRDWIEALTL